MARLAMAAILILEATNKMNISSGFSESNITLHNLILIWIMKNIKNLGWSGKNCGFQDQNRAQKWSDFDETWYLESSSLEPKFSQILLKLDNSWSAVCWF